MEGFTAKWYAKNMKSEAAMEQYRTWAKQAHEMTPEGSIVLEVAPGPGYLAIELARLGGCKITGLDISKKFVEIAQRNADEAGASIELRQGDVAHMPFNNESFDFVLCTSAFKNFTEPINALNEMHRVLKQRGKAWIVDLRRDYSKESLDALVNLMNVSRLNLLMIKWTFNHMLRKRAYTKDEFGQLVSKSAFRTCEIQESAIALEIQLQK
jgi:ubiquinone/menaquinone biosynthesis C-methylase UbiE